MYVSITKQFKITSLFHLGFIKEKN